MSYALAAAIAILGVMPSALGEGLVCARARFLFEITYKITSDDFPDGLKDGYCVLGIEPLIER